MPRAIEHIVDWFCDRVWPFVDPQEQFLSVQLDITNACNLACDHCYLPHHDNVGALGFDQWLLVLDQYESLLKRLRMKPRLTICGGEPLICNFLIPLLEEIRRRFGDCDLSVQTNGTVVTRNIAESLKSLGVWVQVSLDGPDSERNDMIRGRGSFAGAIDGCLMLKDEGVPLTHQAVLSRRTAPWIADFFELPARTGAGSMNFTRLIAEGGAKGLLSGGRDAPLVGLELKNALQTILECSRRSGIATATHGALWHLIDEGLGTPNNVGFASFVVGYRGEFKVTSRTDISLGNVLKEGMAPLFLNHPIMKRLRSGDIEVCGKCSHFSKCRGDRNVSFAEFGHFFGVDAGCWVVK